MEAESSPGVYERAVGGVRRLAALTQDSGDVDVVRDALVEELRLMLDLAEVTVVTRAQTEASRPEHASPNQTESHRCQPAHDRDRGVLLELRSPANAQETVIVLTSQPRDLRAAELTAASALIDVAAVVLSSRSAQRQAATDELTGCLNRRAALARLREEIARSQRAGSPVSCLMLDIDNLKQINDTFGHLEGDRILRETGASLRAELRAYDLAARYGGDEFLVVLPAADHYATTYAAARMTAAIARIKPPAYAPAHPPVSVSVGAATSRPEERPDTLLQRADRALLAAKRARTRRANP